MEAAEGPKATATLQCPKCGLTLFEGHFTFPRCHGCGAFVRACRYCVSYDEGAGQCVEPTSQVESVADPDALTQCPLFKQAAVVLEEEAPLFGRTFWLYAGVGVALSVLAVLLVHYPAIAPWRRAPVGLQARIELPEVLVASQPRPVEVFVYNLDSDRPLGFRVEFPARTTRQFDILDVVPKPSSKEKRGGGLQLIFDPLEPSGYRRLTVPVQPRHTRRVDFEILVKGERGRTITHRKWRRLDVVP